MCSELVKPKSHIKIKLVIVDDLSGYHMNSLFSELSCERSEDIIHDVLLILFLTSVELF